MSGLNIDHLNNKPFGRIIFVLKNLNKYFQSYVNVLDRVLLIHGFGCEFNVFFEQEYPMMQHMARLLPAWIFCL